MKHTLAAGVAAVLVAAVPGAALARKPPHKPRGPALPVAGGRYWGTAVVGGRYAVKEQVVIDRRNARKVALIAAGFTCNGQLGLFTVQNPQLVLHRGRHMYSFSYRLSNNPITFIGTGRQELATITVVVDVLSRTRLVGAYLVHAPDCTAGPVAFDMRLKK